MLHNYRAFTPYIKTCTTSQKSLKHDNIHHCVYALRNKNTHAKFYLPSMFQN